MKTQWMLSDDHEMVRQTAERFARERLLEGYQRREKVHVVDRGLMREMGELGLIAPNVPEEYGGIGAPSMVNGLITEAIAYGDFNMSYVNMLTPLITDVLLRYGSAEVKQRYIPSLAAGETICALGLTEPRGGSDASHLVVSATRKGDRFILKGEKASISFAAQADSVLLFARTDPKDSGPRGVSAFIVPLDLPGVSRTAYDDLGTIPVGRGSIFFDDVEIPADSMIGKENSGFTQVMVGFDLSRLLIALQCVGAAQASVDETWQQVTEREAFGFKLSKFQGVSFPLAEHESWLEAIRSLCYKALQMRDQGLAHTREAAMVKWMAPKYCTEIIQNCLLLNGHYGYTMNLPHQQRMRDVLGLQLGDGTAQIMKTVITRETIGSVGVHYK
ncbi:MAG: acyl-CoA dehydrogenase family protein [Panacagrimonas sp.]